MSTAAKPLTRSRVIRFSLRKGPADADIARWLAQLKERGLEHSTAIRDILRSCALKQDFITPLTRTLYVVAPPLRAHSQIDAGERGDEHPESSITRADMLLAQQLRQQMRGGGLP